MAPWRRVSARRRFVRSVRSAQDLSDPAPALRTRAYELRLRESDCTRRRLVGGLRGYGQRVARIRYAVLVIEVVAPIRSHRKPVARRRVVAGIRHIDVHDAEPTGLCSLGERGRAVASRTIAGTGHTAKAEALDRG